MFRKIQNKRAPPESGADRIPLLSRGGVAATINKCPRSLAEQTGWCPLRNSLLKDTTPSTPAKQLGRNKLTVDAGP